ncbi:hypothetical protein Tco_1232450 [Tanacetum coccineum]
MAIMWFDSPRPPDHSFRESFNTASAHRNIGAFENISIVRAASTTRELEDITLEAIALLVLESLTRAILLEFFKDRPCGKTNVQDRRE